MTDLLLYIDFTKKKEITNIENDKETPLCQETK